MLYFIYTLPMSLYWEGPPTTPCQCISVGRVHPTYCSTPCQRIYAGRVHHVCHYGTLCLYWQCPPFCHTLPLCLYYPVTPCRRVYAGKSPPYHTFTMCFMLSGSTPLSHPANKWVSKLYVLAWSTQPHPAKKLFVLAASTLSYSAKTT